MTNKKPYYDFTIRNAFLIHVYGGHKIPGLAIIHCLAKALEAKSEELEKEKEL